MNFFEKISVFPFYPVKFRLVLTFPIHLLPHIYFFNYNFYLFPFFSDKIRSHLANESVFSVFLPLPFITRASLAERGIQRFFYPRQKGAECLSVKGNKGVQIGTLAAHAAIGDQQNTDQGDAPHKAPHVEQRRQD